MPNEEEARVQVRASLGAAQDELFRGLSKDQKLEAAHTMMARFQDSMFEELTSADSVRSNRSSLNLDAGTPT